MSGSTRTVSRAIRGSYFRQVQTFETDYAVAKITQYESERTGMRVAVVDRVSSKVVGEFALATEIHDDSGAPHTLEHLCFMGSRSYRFNGFLDKLANRVYSSTNAWTATDHTAYLLDTAGWAGFAQMLPVYLEHVILPTLTDHACYTEVHHIDGAGNDAGVVYSEMQGVQNSSAELMELRTKRLMYPEGDGFRYETGGMMEALRVLSAERIRQFHRAMYQPKNLRLCITGQVDHEELLKILDEFEESLLNDVPKINDPFKRPWVDSTPTPPLNESIVQAIEFPDQDESSGEISICFFGPRCFDDVEVRALDVMLSYIAGSSVSILENTLVEKEELASAVYYSVDSRPTVLIWFSLSSVATEALPKVEKRFFEVLQEAASNPLDMDYLSDCLKRLKRQIVYGSESNLTIFSESLITDHLFGSRDGMNLEKTLASLEGYRVLEAWTEGQWQDFLMKYFVENKHVSILGAPSSTLFEKLTTDEINRVKKQQEKLGKDGLEKLAKELEDAKAKNNVPIPDEILAAFKVPSPDTIPFIDSTTARSGLAKDMGRLENEIQDIIDKDRSDLPLFIHFEHVPAKCVYFDLVLSTEAVPLELKPLLAIYLANFFTTPINRKGNRIEFEDMVKQLEKDTISYEIETGTNLSNSELIRIKFVVEKDKYKAAIEWLRELLFESIFDADRIHSTLSRLMSEVPSLKREGNDMVASVDLMVHYDPKSSARAQNTLVKALYLKRIKKLLYSSPQDVLNLLASVRRYLLTFSNMRVLVTADVKSLPDPVSSWKPLVEGLNTSEPLQPLQSRREILSDAARNPGSLAYIIPMPAIDSSFATFTAGGLEGFDHPRLPALMVAAAYLDATEGPLWVAVRGTGLAYGSNFSYSCSTGRIGFSVYRSPDAFKAYEAARSVVKDYVEGKREFNQLALEGAVSRVVVNFANEQTTIVSAALVSFANQVVLGIPKDYGVHMLKKVRQVTVEEVRAVMKDVVLEVFQPDKTNLVATCATIMAKALEKNFKNSGFEPQVEPLEFFQDDYGLGKAEGEEEDESEDEDGEDEDDDGEGEEVANDKRTDEEDANMAGKSPSK